MTSSVATILARLAPVRDRVLMRPLSETEIQELERQVGLSAPPALRDYLGHVGLFQDLTDNASDYQVFDGFKEFAQARQFLLKHFDETAARLFPFADDGAGDVIAATEISGETQLFFADHETLEVEEIGSFFDWLSGVVDLALKQDRPANDGKLWCVAFSFRSSDAAPIVSILKQFGAVELGTWTAKGATPAGVHRFEAPLSFAGRSLTLMRSEYWTWNQPSFAFDFDEPVGVPAAESRIRMLDAAFKAAGLGYVLVDYGPLDAKGLEEEIAREKLRTQEGSSRPRRPWWKFWE